MNNKLLKVFALSSAVYFTQGIETLPSQGLFYYLKESLKFPPEKIMLVSSIITFAWLIKPVIGYIVDNFLTKKTWILASLAASLGLAAILGLRDLPLTWIVGILIVSSCFAAFRDVSADGIMCVEGKKFNATGKIQSIQWISISMATLITGVAGGYIAEKWDYKTGFLLLVPMYLLAGAVAFSYRGQETVLKETASKFFRDMRTLCCSKKLVVAGLFVFLYRFSPSFGAPLFFIQKDVFGWSKLWIGAIGTFSTLFAIVGAILYFKFSQKIPVKKTLFFSVFLGAATTLSYLYYTPFTAVAYDTIYNLLGMFIYLLVLDFMARNSISGLEAASFAFLTSLSNLALVASNVSGAFLFPRIGLKGLIVLSSLTSFLCLLLIPKIATNQDRCE